MDADCPRCSFRVREWRIAAARRTRAGNTFGGLEYEKSKRVAQIGATRGDNKQTGGKAKPGFGFHIEGLGLSNK